MFNKMPGFLREKTGIHPDSGQNSRGLYQNRFYLYNRSHFYGFDASMRTIFNVFGPSPIKPIEQHMRKVHHAAKELQPFFEAVLKGDWVAAEVIQHHISSLEKEADDIKRDLRLHLPKGLFLPISRTDLLDLLSVQDRIANTAEDIAELVLLRKVSFPPTISDLIMPFLNCCLEASHQACQAINELDELLETGFRGNEVHIVEDMIRTLDVLERQSDQQLSNIRKELFRLENKLPDIEMIFLYKLVQWIGDLADHAQSAGGRLLILIAR